MPMSALAVIRRTPDYAESRTADAYGSRFLRDPVDELRHSQDVRAGSETLTACRWHGSDPAKYRWVRFWQGSSV